MNRLEQNEILHFNSTFITVSNVGYKCFGWYGTCQPSAFSLMESPAITRKDLIQNNIKINI
jgi:hypothetical protein